MALEEIARSPKAHGKPSAESNFLAEEDWRLVVSNRALSAAEQIAERISRDVLAGVYKPGQRIIEQDIADSFQVSRGPVRDAIRILEREGVVEILARRGAHVTSLSVQEVDDIFAIRGTLIALAITLATPLLSEEEIVQVRNWVDQMSATSSKGGSTEEYVPNSYRISLFLSRRCQNERLFEMIRSMSRQTLRYSHLSLSSPDRRERSVGIWRSLVNALEKRDGVQAAVLAEHLIKESGEAARKQLLANKA